MEAHLNTRIYILDDDRYFGKYLCTNLKSKYPDTHHFPEAEECIKAFNQPPHILILDHKLKNYSGFDFIKNIADHLTSSTVVIYLSSQESVHVALQAMKYGAIDYLEKKESSLKTVIDTIERIEELTNNFRNALDPSKYWNKTA